MHLKKALIPAALLAVFALPTSALAEGKGVNEIAGSLSYNDIEDTTLTALSISYGRYLTERHELGLSAAYLDLEVDGLGSVDGTMIGAFYHLNFPMEGTLQPYIGINVASIGGDLGDAYDLGYGATAGLKLFPYENAGINISVAFQSLQGAEDWIDDADGTQVGVGLFMRF